MRGFFVWRCASLLALILVARPLWACINEYEDDKPKPTFATNFGTLGPDEYVAQLTRGGKPPETEKELADLKEKAASGRFQDRSNYAVALIRQGRAAEALPIFEQVAAEQPNEYTAGANLGTAYELTGDNVKALEWIRKGIKLNPEAHGGTEWLHAKILEAKVQLADNPDWLKTNTILGVDFGDDAEPAQPQGRVIYDGTPKSESEVRKALEYQLRERMSLVDAPDPVVADLLAALGNMLMLEGANALAASVYGLALGYEPAQALLIQVRHAALKPTDGRLPSWARRVSQPNFWTVAACFVAIALYVGRRLYTRAYSTL